MEILTNKQLDILEIIKEFIDENGYSPSVREIGEIAKLNSPATVHTHLTQLVKKGYITYVPNKFRTIRVLEVE